MRSPRTGKAPSRRPPRPGARPVFAPGTGRSRPRSRRARPSCRTAPPGVPPWSGLCRTRRRADTFGSAPRSTEAAGNPLNNGLLKTYVRRSGISRDADGVRHPKGGQGPGLDQAVHRGARHPEQCRRFTDGQQRPRIPLHHQCTKLGAILWKWCHAMECAAVRGPWNIQGLSPGVTPCHPFVFLPSCRAQRGRIPRFSVGVCGSTPGRRCARRSLPGQRRAQMVAVAGADEIHCLSWPPPPPWFMSG